MNVKVFIPCYMDQLYPTTGFSTIKILEAAGCNVTINTEATCCGQPPYSEGFMEEARRVSLKFIKDFHRGEDFLIIPSTSCTDFVRNGFSDLFSNSAQRQEARKIQDSVFELSEFLVHILQKTKFSASFKAKVTYLDSCKGLRGCHIREEPRLLLRNVEGLELLEMEDQQSCCGFGGTFSIKNQAVSAAMADKKIKNAEALGAEFIVSTEASCLMHLSGRIRKTGNHIKIIHIADILASNL